MAPPAENSTSVALFMHPAQRFANSIGATRDAAAELMRSQALSASKVEADFLAEAELMCPWYSSEAHVAAASLVHRAIHQFQNARAALPEKTEASIDAAYRDVFGPLQDQLETITGDPNAEHHYQHVWQRIAGRPSTERLLGSALLTQAVSEFEVLIRRLVRGVLEASPNVLLGSDQKFSLRDLQRFASIDDVRRALAEDVADRLLRKGFVSWMAWFASQLKVDIPEVFSDSYELTEVFQRRHLIVHNDGVVNDAYRSSLGSAPALPSDGTRLTVSGQYLARAVDLLEIAGIKIAAAAAFRFAKTEEIRITAEEVLDRMCFEALQRERWAVARDVSSWLIPQIKDQPASVRLQVNHWVAREAIDGRDSIEAEVRSWDTRSLDDQYKLARLALLGDVDRALELGAAMLSAGSMSEVDWRTWPVLASVRDHARATNAGLPATQVWNTSHGH